MFYMVCTTVMDCLIILLAAFSFSLCIRSINHNLHLRNVTRAIWLVKFKKPLGARDEAKFVQYWYFIIIFGDICLAIGSILKIFVTFRVRCCLDFGSQLANYKTGVVVQVMEIYTVCALLLGCATMVVWIGVLKYLNYFHHYNVC